MNCNVGKTEQIIRISIGAGIIFLGLAFRSWWGLIGLAPILTGATRYCPANTLLRIDNCKKAR
jgi:amino acid permease